VEVYSDGLAFEFYKDFGGVFRGGIFSARFSKEGIKGVEFIKWVQ
jgi:hypothetical protein